MTTHSSTPALSGVDGPAPSGADGPRLTGPSWQMRAAIAAAAVLIAALAYGLRGVIGPRGQGAVGIVVFIAVIIACSADMRRINWRTVFWGMALQWFMALFILKFEIGGVRPGYALFSAIATVVRRFLGFTAAGAEMVFGGLANQEVMSKLFPGGFVFAFTALPTIIFVSSFFTVLYYFGILQFVVKLMARAMIYLLQTSGAETLSAAANVFMGQTEAPLIVKPYVPKMTQSELLAMMVGGFATISGGIMAVYISLGADPVAILTTSVMAAPCGLYLSKILLPETEEPDTRGTTKTAEEQPYMNAVDAAAAGASDGTKLAINVAAMLIAFMAFLALFDYVFALVHPSLTLARVFSWVFAPIAVLMGVTAADVPEVADLLGTKLVANEFVAYVKLTGPYRTEIDPRSYALATYALTGFANFGSVGIQLGGIGAMAPGRRGDLARLGGRALLAGFVATLINASIAAILI
jgi:CNT family concentrative nucleoside transporter